MNPLAASIVLVTRSKLADRRRSEVDCQQYQSREPVVSHATSGEGDERTRQRH